MDLQSNLASGNEVIYLEEIFNSNLLQSRSVRQMGTRAGLRNGIVVTPTVSTKI